MFLVTYFLMKIILSRLLLGHTQVQYSSLKIRTWTHEWLLVGLPICSHGMAHHENHPNSRLDLTDGARNTSRFPNVFCLFCPSSGSWLVVWVDDLLGIPWQFLSHEFISPGHCGVASMTLKASCFVRMCRRGPPKHNRNDGANQEVGMNPDLKIKTLAGLWERYLDWYVYVGSSHFLEPQWTT